MQRRRRGQRGFTLLEAIVALAIIGLTLVPVMGFLAEASRQLQVAADANLRSNAQQTVAAFMQSVNPIDKPEGEEILSPQMTVRWVSTPIVEPNTEPRLGGRLGGYTLGFYQIDVTVIRNEAEWFTFQVKRIGYRASARGLGGPEMP
jgi:general secretion pathway protein I